MTKNSTNTVSRNDNIITAETFTVPVGKLATEIARLGLTVDRIAGIYYDASTGNVHVPFITGTLDANTKGKALVATPNYPALMAWTNIEGIQNFETTTQGKVDPVSWLPVLDQLQNLKDKYGNKAVEFYGVGYALKTTRQFVVLDDKRVLDLTDVGITSIRYDFTNQRYYGIRLNERSVGTQIVALDMETVQQNPLSFMKIDTWTPIAGNVEPAMISLSRVKVVDGVTAFFANQVGNVCKIATVNDVAGDLIVSWDKTVHTTIMMIGTVTNDGLYVGYRPTAEDQIEIYLETPKPREFPFLTLHI